MTEYIGGYRVHPVASMFPMSDDETLQALAEDIKKNGLREPVVLAEYVADKRPVCEKYGLEIDELTGHILGKVPEEAKAELASGRELVLIDGRNRMKACEIAGVDPVPMGQRYSPLELEPQDPGFEEYIGSWIISKNLHRRHLSTGQRAAVAARYIEHFAEQAKKRQLATLKQNRVNEEAEDTVVADLPQREQDPEDAKSRAQAGKMFNVSARSVSSAKKVMDESPEEFKKIETGESNPTRALKTLKEKEPRPAPTEQEVLAAREAVIAKEANRLLKKYDKAEMTILLHYIHLGEEK